MLPNLTASHRLLHHRTSSFTSFLSSLSFASSSSTSSPTLPLHQVLHHSSITYNIFILQFLNFKIPHIFLLLSDLNHFSRFNRSPSHHLGKQTQCISRFFLFSNYFLFMHFYRSVSRFAGQDRRRHWTLHGCKTKRRFGDPNFAADSEITLSQKTRRLLSSHTCSLLAFRNRSLHSIFLFMLYIRFAFIYRYKNYNKK
ncbi:hypothetical protein V8G54_014065 [Vigna mungo]|uniref:Transmembrane protein n=1 Tax=Vigna mungo TaxID=3915 RepID=A0AAQ3NIF0_VIGMU